MPKTPFRLFEWLLIFVIFAASLACNDRQERDVSEPLPPETNPANKPAEVTPSKADLANSDIGDPKSGSTTRKNTAPPGFYLVISTCHVCATNNPDRHEELAFRQRGYTAFYGHAEYAEDYQNIRFIEKHERKAPDYPTEPFPAPLFVGPFRSEAGLKWCTAHPSP